MPKYRLKKIFSVVVEENFFCYNNKKWIIGKHISTKLGFILRTKGKQKERKR